MDFTKHNLSLTINKSSTSYTEFVLANTNHDREKKTYQRRLIFVLVSYLVFHFAFSHKLLVAHVCFILILVIFVYRLFSLVDREILKVVKDFGIEKSVVYTFNRNRQVFIQQSLIHKVVINEVIYFVSQRYTRISWDYGFIYSRIA